MGGRHLGNRESVKTNSPFRRHIIELEQRSKFNSPMTLREKKGERIEKPATTGHH